MTKEQHIEYWVRSAKDDLITVSSLYNSKRYVHALFFAHLVLEKLSKAHWVKDNVENVPPRTHNLIRLITSTNLELDDIELAFLREFNDFQLEGRYPDYQFELHKKCDLQFTDNILKQINSLVSCFLEKLL